MLRKSHTRVALLTLIVILAGVIEVAAASRFVPCLPRAVFVAYHASAGWTMTSEAALTGDGLSHLEVWSRAGETGASASDIIIAISASGATACLLVRGLEAVAARPESAPKAPSEKHLPTPRADDIVARLS